MQIEKLTNLAKFDNEARIAEGIVYSPMTVDSQGDYATAQEIEAAAHNFIAQGLVKSIDVGHSGQPSGSTVVESRIAKASDPDYPQGSWVMAVKCSAPVWAQVKAGELKAFSIGGKAQRVKKSINGVTANELTGLKINSVSLVKKGANQKEFSILKSGETMNQEQLADLVANAVEKAVSGLSARLDGLGQPPTDIAKQAAQQDEIDLQRLCARRNALQDRLEQVWAGDHVTDRVGRQNEILSEIEKCDVEIESIRGRDSIDFDGRHSAFAFRGGQSQRISANFNGPDALGVRENDGVRKAESEIDLSSLKI
jgi:hypothetical protein